MNENEEPVDTRPDSVAAVGMAALTWLLDLTESQPQRRGGKGRRGDLGGGIPDK